MYALFLLSCEIPQPLSGSSSLPPVRPPPVRMRKIYTKPMHPYLCRPLDRLPWLGCWDWVTDRQPCFCLVPGSGLQRIAARFWLVSWRVGNFLQSVEGFIGLG